MIADFTFYDLCKTGAGILVLAGCILVAAKYL